MTSHRDSIGPRRGARCAVAAGLAAGMLAAGVALAQSGLRINGAVNDLAGEAVATAQIVLTPVDDSGQPTAGGVEERVKTNKKGKFVFGFAKPGSYRLTVEEDHGLQLHAVSLKMRNADRKPILLPTGEIIEDVSGAVDPADPHILLYIPKDAFFVTLELKIGPPQVVQAPASGGAELQEVGSEAQEVVDLITSNQFDAALARVETLLPEQPGSAPLYYLKAFALLRLGRIGEAAAPAREATRLDPELVGPAGLLGQILGEQGAYEEAAAMMRRELERVDVPAQRAPLLLGLGQCMLELDRPEEAIAPLEEAAAINPDSTQVKIQLADAYIKSGRENEAEALLSSDMNAADAAVLHFNLASHLMLEEKWDAAITHLGTALELDPQLAEAHRSLAQAHLGRGAIAEAVAEFEAYLEARPDAEDASDTQKIIDALQSSLK